MRACITMHIIRRGLDEDIQPEDNAEGARGRLRSKTVSPRREEEEKMRIFPRPCRTFEANIWGPRQILLRGRSSAFSDFILLPGFAKASIYDSIYAPSILSITARA